MISRFLNAFRKTTAAPATPVLPWGIYVLANDNVMEWVLALFESLRIYASDLPLLVIPYDDRQTALRELASRNGYGYLEHPEIERYHRIGHRLYPSDEFCARGFRKLAAFSGPFEQFFFIDSDVVALAPLRETCAALQGSALDLVYFDIHPTHYQPGSPFGAFAAAGRVEFNGGLWVGRRGALDSARFERSVSKLGRDWKKHLAPIAEQPFLNFVAADRDLKTASIADFVPDACSTSWPAVGRLVNDGVSWRLRGSTHPHEGRRFLFAHWAGFQLTPEMPNRDVWETFRSRART